ESVWPPRLIDRRVEHETPVGGERRTVRRVVDLVREVFAGEEVADTEGEPFVSVGVDSPREQLAVTGDIERAEREELVAFGFDVPVKKHLFTGDVDARGEDGGSPVQSIGDRG